MKRSFTLLLLLTLTYSLWAQEPQRRGSEAIISGVILSKEEGTPIPYATVVIEGNHQRGCISDQQGAFSLKVPSGEQRLIVSYIGYQNYEETISLQRGETLTLKIELEDSSVKIDEVVVRAESKSTQINKTAYNVQSLTLAGMKNSSLNVSDALARVGGVKIREAGGVGSDANITLNGFSGSHVKIFIDGVPLDQSNSAFSLSNMPANFAERIDVYSGVVPIEFGTDAIGGVINIITNKELRYQAMNLDASYSYGSFNTHSSYLNFGQVFKSGLTYNLNLYQNYSDNDYWVNNTVATYTENPGWAPSPDYSDQTIYRIRRFNDAYRNETAIATVGVTNKPWADLLTLKLNLSQYDNQVQTGVVQDIVYGEKKRSGHSITPTLDFSKMNLLIEGLSLRLSANYTNGYTHNYDPATHSYSWSGESVLNSSLSPTDNELRNNSYNANLISKYTQLKNSEFTLSNTFGSNSRITRSLEEGTSAYTAWEIPKVSIKNITGASYRYSLREKFDATLFVKYYWQANEGVVLDDSSNYVLTTRTDASWGYGAAASYFLLEGLQSKLSFEKAYRLPTATEIFGDEDLEIGTFDLNPETSYNYNLNLSYTKELQKHTLHLDGGLIYRDTRDYIIRSVSSSNAFSSSASYENHGQVETKGYTIGLRYNYDRRFNFGGTFNNLSARNAESSLHGGTDYQTLTYGLRLPNLPYIYANGDATLNFFKLFDKEDSLTLTYELFYQHEFPLNWETIGYASTKSIVPTQLSHNIMINYGFQKGKYNLSFEARNITDAHLYDNYSLQKAGRAFYTKLRVNINQPR